MGENENTAVSASNVSMTFNLTKDRVTGLKEYAVRALSGNLFYEKFEALRGVSFDVEKGEVFGVMGFNGAGKSTLLKIIAGVFRPTTGTVKVRGELTPLLELGAGFDPECSARDNIYMNGAMYGHPPKYMKTKYDEIIDFAELRGFEDVAVKNFSSGMAARLGFAVATSVEPDILIVDEILGVGDYKFQAKCKKRISGMIAKGATVLLTSHVPDAVKAMCQRALLLHRGEAVMVGKAEDVAKAYEGL